MDDFPLVKEAVALWGRLIDALDAFDRFDQAEPDCECDSCQHARRLYMAIDKAHDRALRRANGDASIVRHYTIVWEQ